MRTRHQYRITLEGSTGPILDTQPAEQWSRIAEVCETRGLTAQLDRRTISDPDLLPLLTNPAGYVLLGQVLISPWEPFAQMNPRP